MVDETSQFRGRAIDSCDYRSPRMVSFMHFREHIKFWSFSVLNSQGFSSLFRDEFLVGKCLDRLIYLIAVFFGEVSINLPVKLTVLQLSVCFS